MGEKSIRPVIITRERETPSLLSGPQRLHYQFSVALPLTHLTFVSVLQGLALGILLYNIHLPPENVSWENFFDISFKQYFYLPYIISSLLILLIWIQFVHASMFINWPLSVFQSGLFFLLTICEVLAFQTITTPSLSPWLFGIGCVSIVGGFIRIHNARWYKGSAQRRSLSFLNIVQPLIHRAQLDGWIYVGAGIVLAVISRIVLFLPLVSWIILVLTLASLCGCVWLYTRFRQSVLKKMALDSDLEVLPHGSITYKKNPSKLSDKESDHETVHLQDRTQLLHASSNQQYGTYHKHAVSERERLKWIFKVGVISLVIYVIGNWIFHWYTKV